MITLNYKNEKLKTIKILIYLPLQNHSGFVPIVFVHDSWPRIRINGKVEIGVGTSIVPPSASITPVLRRAIVTPIVIVSILGGKVIPIVRGEPIAKSRRSCVETADRQLIPVGLAID